MGLVQGRSQYNWEHGIPCTNPQCKSYGKPHPNCQCGAGGPQSGKYGGSGPTGPSKAITQNYAEGGNVEDAQAHFCSTDQPHQPDCEHYAGNSELGKLILKNAIQRHTSEDDITESMLGKSKPEHAVHGLAANIGAAGILGNINDSPIETGTKKNKLVDIANKQLAKKAGKFLNKVSMVSQDKAMHPDFIKESIRPAVQKLIGKSNPHIIDAVISAISKGETDSLGSVMDHAQKVSKGHKAIDDSIDALFSGGDIDQDPSEDDREKVKDFIKRGGLNAQIMNQMQAMTNQPVQMMAEGGEINANSHRNPVEKTFPEQAMLMGMTKTSINNYLQQQEPQPESKLPFDANYKNADKEKKYNGAVDIANKPLSVLKHVQGGTLVPEHLQHLSGMYPDLYNHLSKKSTERIMRAQLSGDRPSYKIRQGLSMFVGSPLDSTMTPQAIQSIQAIYAPKPPSTPPGVPPKKQKKNTSKLGDIAKDHYTEPQAAAQRSTAWD